MRIPVLTISLLFAVVLVRAQTIRVGAKHFNEGYILSEIIAQVLENDGYTVVRNYNLGGTLVCFEALRNNEIDVYPEYSGTLAAEILRKDNLLYPEIRASLQREFKMDVSEPYGFSNTYALVLKADLSDARGIRSISHLLEHPELRLGLSYEFLKRQDGWDNLAATYSLKQQPVGLEHGLAYQALDEGKIDVTDAYSTDGEITGNNLVVLMDDRKFFPVYAGTSLYRMDFPQKAKEVLSRLAGKIDEAEMQAMNAEVLYKTKTFDQVARAFLIREGLSANKRNVKVASVFNDILHKTATHLRLTFVALVLATAFAIPLGVFLYWRPGLSRSMLYITGLLQTIPSIALLAIMIPVFGIGVLPATVALFLYAILPILRNTLTGLQSVDPLLKKVADGIGMNRFQKLRYIEFRLALPSILAGIKTAAVINVGTATLAAFIGAGGLGEFIVTGLALNNTQLILRGAIPAALLALLVEFGFTFLEKWWIPKHLR